MLKLREEKTKEKMKFFLRPEIELTMFCKNDDEKELKLPSGEPAELSYQEFKDYIRKKSEIKKAVVEQTETILAKGFFWMAKNYRWGAYHWRRFRSYKGAGKGRFREGYTDWEKR